ncbi:MAG TPA: GMC family oxidoreductase N-terminal domain-containing protein [Steroidobacteraceae bacterium]|nr:GMC family oxidoreductase N-terminal domain-containing protein [Steroidobacteraceae bacterium]HRX89604.1 GMC family oxidoreductase N-terminal domain-containing protein [Steroidobacteraceae bacterium]
MSEAGAIWDYIIVGAGSAGCVLANRLSTDPKVRVLLLEAGGSDRSPYIQIPAALVKAVGNPRFDWCNLAEPDPSRFGKVDLWPAGKVLGGSSSINGMLFVRGAREDFDGWAALGNTGWGYDDVLPYFRKLERSEIGAADVRGHDGPMNVAQLRTTHPLAAVFRQAAEECGLPPNPDYNGWSQLGVCEPQVTQLRGQRMSTARAYLDPIRQRRNLRVITGSQATNLLLLDGRCVGVQTRERDRVVRHHARREVLSAAGSLGSPKLLMLSGIGPGAELQAHGIAVAIDRAAVGANLREHANSLVCADVNVRTYNAEMASGRMALHLANWLLFRRGPATSPYPHGIAFLRSRPEEPIPDLQMMFGPFAFGFDERGIVPYTKPAVSLVVNACRPRSSGRLRLRSSDAAAPPIIEHQMYTDAEDLRRQIAGCRMARRILQSQAFKPYLLGEFLPGPAVASDEQLADSIRRTSFLGYHPIGTCRMGSDQNAVVSPSLEVHGVRGLRVVDASIMPTHIAANTNGATIMIAEKAADMITRGAG